MPKSHGSILIVNVGHDGVVGDARPDLKEKLSAAFMEPIGGSTQDLANFMQTELRVMTPVIKRTGIKVD